MKSAIPRTPSTLYAYGTKNRSASAIFSVHFVPLHSLHDIFLAHFLSLANFPTHFAHVLNQKSGACPGHAIARDLAS